MTEAPKVKIEVEEGVEGDSDNTSGVSEIDEVTFLFSLVWFCYWFFVYLLQAVGGSPGNFCYNYILCS